MINKDLIIVVVGMTLGI